MQKNSKRVKLFVEYAYSQIMFVLLVLGGIGMIIMLYFLPASSRIAEVFWICIICMTFIVSLIGSVASYQIAFLTEEGITFYIAFWKIKLIKWSEITDITVKELPTYRSTMKDFNKKWIVFYTAESDEEKTGGENRRGNKYPGQIKYTVKNISLLSQFCKQNNLDRILEFIDNVDIRTRSK